MKKEHTRIIQAVFEDVRALVDMGECPFCYRGKPTLHTSHADECPLNGVSDADIAAIVGAK
jgi:hypothetical protein